MISSDKGTINQNANCNHFRDVSFGINVHLIFHTDDDAKYSVSSVYQYDHPYKLNNNILAYFSFPCLVIAVALCAGDVLIFNAHEPHSVSS